MPAINYTAWWFWINVAQTVFTAAIGIYVWWSKRDEVTAGRFSKLEKAVSERITRKELDEHEVDNKDRLDRHRKEMVEMTNKLIKMETDICHLPSQLDMRVLGDRISGLQKSLGEFSGRLQGVNRAVDLINEFLIQKGLTGK